MGVRMGDGSVLAPAAPQRFGQYPEYRDSGIEWLGKIPAHWEVGRLKNTVSECRNGVWGEDPDGTNDVACIRVADFDRDTYSVDLSSLTLRHVDPRALSTHRLRRADLLLEKSGGGEQQPVGAVVIFADDLPAVCSNFIARMPVNDGHSPVFLVHLHAALYSSRINVRSIKQSIGIQNLDSGSYLNELVGLPPFHEQHEIAEFLHRETTKVDALIAKQQELIGLLQEKRIALISHAVTKGLNPGVAMRDSGVEWLGKIPAHWDIVQLRRVAFDRCDGPFGSGLKSTHYAAEGVRVVRLQNIGYGEFEGADAAFIPQEHCSKLGDHSVVPGDLLIAGLGDTNHPAGRACVAPEDHWVGNGQGRLFSVPDRPIAGDTTVLGVSAKCDGKRCVWTDVNWSNPTTDEPHEHRGKGHCNSRP